jgi:hypothetical protein
VTALTRLGKLALFLCAAWLFSAASWAQHLSQRLILRDGSYQSVSKFEVKGGRVRYLSAERGEWEEVPNDLIDWDATKKFNEGRSKAEPSAEARKLDEEAEAELKAEAARSPAVAPGLNLPSDGGVFLFDRYQQEPQLVELAQNGGEIKRNMTGNILRGAINPIASSKQSIQLPGQHAKVQAHVAQPAIFLNTLPAEAASKDAAVDASQGGQYRIVRAEVKKDARVVGNIKIAVYGKVSQQQRFIETKLEPVSGGWVKLTPVRELAPGEYAVVELLGKEGMNLYVWDFGVNPSAKANPSAWKPVPVKPSKPDGPGKLEKRD